MPIITYTIASAYALPKPRAWPPNSAPGSAPARWARPRSTSPAQPIANRPSAAQCEGPYGAKRPSTVSGMRRC
ncbi:hypothetical protein [Actinomadura luteofluorescens]|uniref:hypothetical protein n=1 Tax=Actinomadura luteofluorescens TaxID=46163 RepID=UPI00216486A6|nr:hypothetical protein [Actinomadura glauciflava]